MRNTEQQTFFLSESSKEKCWFHVSVEKPCNWNQSYTTQNQLICRPFSLYDYRFSFHSISWSVYLFQSHCTCDQQRSLHSLGSMFQLRQTWWWCPGQQWCQKQRWQLWYRPEYLCSQPAVLTAPRTPGTYSMHRDCTNIPSEVKKSLCIYAFQIFNVSSTGFLLYRILLLWSQRMWLQMFECEDLY